MEPKWEQFEQRPRRTKILRAAKTISSREGKRALYYERDIAKLWVPAIVL